MRTRVEKHEIGWVSWMVYPMQMATKVVAHWNQQLKGTYAVIPDYYNQYRVGRIS